jgi:DNA polymerase III subunit gamma/tau
VMRVAELCGEEDLTRHLQIMLRTHSELGYKQEQRFHLELGLLKMAHAQRLLPIEQLLSEVAALPGAAGGSRPARPAIVGTAIAAETRRTDAFRPNHPSSGQTLPNQVSPFAADSARKSGPRQETSTEATVTSAPRVVASSSAPARVVMGSAAPAEFNHSALAVADPGTELAEERNEPRTEIQERIPVSAPKPATDSVESIRNAVLQALTDGNQPVLVSMLEAGEWAIEGNQVVIRISESQPVVDMSLSAEGRRLAIASASGVLGRAVKLTIVAGATVSARPKDNGAKSNGASSTLSGRGRAEQDAVVRRMQEKFGAEIRTVIDYREKR